MSHDTCPVCGVAFKYGDTLTSDYDDTLVHFECGPDKAVPNLMATLRLSLKTATEGGAA